MKSKQKCFTDFMKKKRLVVGVIIVVLLLGGALTIKYLQDRKNEQANKNLLCSSDALGKDIKLALAGFDASNPGPMKPLKEKVEALEDHEKSANCMYVLAAYNAYIGDFTKAKDFYAKLQALKAAGTSVNEDFNVKLAKLDEYMKNVDEIIKQAKANTFTTGPGIIEQNAQ